ncbi:MULTISPECIES: hypothetical protein [Dyella]|uniref:Secreted protein n=2 Tax=Dyella TaxID=231454 RepID=A0A4R0YY53_9GAMM|nr:MULTISPECIES: hypothetical protein [Dyella]TBR40470.1 hypothetical protein EYV96_10030 [Dyella terrae]TCI11948.1 hypothetical protein EZM97_00840 [Dyella soli]
MGIRTYLFIGIISVGSLQVAAAADADARDINALQRSSVDASGTRDVSGNGGDALGVTHSSSTPSQASPTNGSNNENCPTDGSSDAQHSRRVNIGWQSLLPGSIQ